MVGRLGTRVSDGPNGKKFATETQVLGIASRASWREFWRGWRLGSAREENPRNRPRNNRKKAILSFEVVHLVGDLMSWDPFAGSTSRVCVFYPSQQISPHLRSKRSNTQREFCLLRAARLYMILRVSRHHVYIQSLNIHLLSRHHVYIQSFIHLLS